MTDADPQGAPPRDEPFSARALLVFAWLVWVAGAFTVVVLWFGAAITSAPFFGTTPTPDQLSESAGLLTAAAIVAGVTTLLMLTFLVFVRRSRPLRVGGSVVLVVALLTPWLPLIGAVSFHANR